MVVAEYERNELPYAFFKLAHTTGSVRGVTPDSGRNACFGLVAVGVDSGFKGSYKTDVALICDVK